MDVIYTHGCMILRATPIWRLFRKDVIMLSYIMSRYVDNSQSFVSVIFQFLLYHGPRSRLLPLSYYTGIERLAILYMSSSLNAVPWSLTLSMSASSRYMLHILVSIHLARVILVWDSRSF